MNASSTDVILGSVVIITATSVIRNARAKTKVTTTWKPVVFGFGLLLALLAIAIVAPGFAKGLALLGLVGAFVTNGPALFDTIGSLGK
jgi:hypothetical protein